MHTSACFKIVDKCKISKFARFKFKDFSRIFKYFQAPYLFQALSRALEFLFQIQALSRISQARYVVVCSYGGLRCRKGRGYVVEAGDYSRDHIGQEEVHEVRVARLVAQIAAERLVAGVGGLVRGEVDREREPAAALVARKGLLAGMTAPVRRQLASARATFAALDASSPATSMHCILVIGDAAPISFGLDHKRLRFINAVRLCQAQHNKYGLCSATYDIVALPAIPCIHRTHTRLTALCPGLPK